VRSKGGELGLVANIIDFEHRAGLNKGTLKKNQKEGKQNQKHMGKKGAKT